MLHLTKASKRRRRVDHIRTFRKVHQQDKSKCQCHSVISKWSDKSSDALQDCESTHNWNTPNHKYWIFFFAVLNTTYLFNAKHRWEFLHCELTTGKGWQSSMSSWLKTFFLTSPWNWISPQKLDNSKYCQHERLLLPQSSELCRYFWNRWRLTQQYRHAALKRLWTFWTLCKESKDPRRTDDLENKHRQTLTLTDIIRFLKNRIQTKLTSLVRRRFQNSCWPTSDWAS